MTSVRIRSLRRRRDVPPRTLLAVRSETPAVHSARLELRMTSPLMPVRASR